MNKFAAIPTKYNGVQFRSRLEARWAAFFDLCKWDWEYEPFDLPGWIPDFIIRGNNDLLVEVKPWNIFTEEGEFNQGWEEQVNKIAKARCSLDVLLLSGQPSNKSLSEPHLLPSWILEEKDFKDNPQSYLFEMVIADHYGHIFLEKYPIYLDPSYCQKGKVLAHLKEISEEKLSLFWKESGNKVQWKKP